MGKYLCFLFIFMLSGCASMVSNNLLDDKEVDKKIDPLVYFYKKIKEYQASFEYKEVINNRKNKKLSLERMITYDEGLSNLDFVIKGVNEEKLHNIIHYNPSLIEYKNIEKGIEYLKKSFKLGQYEALYRLGEYYFHNPNAGKDRYKIAYKYFVKGLAFNRYYESLFNLAMMYYYGQGVNKQISVALACLEHIAEDKHALANHNLGVMYFKGLHLPKNTKKAIKHFQIAADRLSPFSAYIVMKYYLHKINNTNSNIQVKLIKNSFNFNRFLYQKLTLQYDKFFVAEIVNINMEKIYKLLADIIDNSLPGREDYESSLKLGLIKLKGIAVKKEEKVGLEYIKDLYIKYDDSFFRKCAAFFAVYHSGISYYHGIGTKKNIELAKEKFDEGITFYEKFILK